MEGAGAFRPLDTIATWTGLQARVFVRASAVFSPSPRFLSNASALPTKLTNRRFITQPTRTGSVASASNRALQSPYGSANRSSPKKIRIERRLNLLSDRSTESQVFLGAGGFDGNSLAAFKSIRPSIARRTGRKASVKIETAPGDKPPVVKPQVNASRTVAISAHRRNNRK